MKISKIAGLSNKPFAGRPFLIVLFIAIEIFIVSYFLNDYREHDSLYREQLLRTFDAGYLGAITSYGLAVQVMFSDEVNKPEVLKLVALAHDDDKKRDVLRNELHRLMLPSYERQMSLGILQVHFHLKDGTSFLRMHAPEKYGDNLFRRTAVYEVNKLQRPVKGYEVGYFADGYRFMYPLFYNGRHVGSVEFGITAEGIIKHLNQIYPAHYLFMINRTIVDNMTYSDWEKRNYRKCGLSDNFMIAQSTIEDTTVVSINQNLRNKVRDRLAGMERFVEKNTVDGKDYLITFLPVRDVKDDATAYLVQYINDTYLLQSRTIITDITLFTLLLASIFYSIDTIQSRRKSLEQKNVELENISNELQQYKLLSRYARDIILFIGIDGRIIEANEAAEREYGYSREDLRSLNIADLRSGATLHSIEDQMSQASERGLLFETEHRRRDGSTIPVEVSSIGVDIGNRRVLLSIIRDITGRKRAEEEREQFFRFFRTSADLMAIADPNGSFIKTNPAFSETLGYSEAELVSKPFIEFVHPDDKQSTIDEMARQLEKGYSLNFENRYVCKDGSLRWLSWRAIFNKREGITFATARDITEHKRAEEKLRISEERLRNAQHLARIGNWSYDIQSGSLWWSDELYRMFSLRSEDGPVTFEHFLNRVHPDDRKKLEEEIALGLNYHSDYRIVLSDGKFKHIHEEVEISRDEEGNIKKYTGTAQDITDQKMVEAKMQKSLKEKETLLREIHHRVKNNMQVITSLLKLQAQKIQDQDLKKPFEESEQRIRAMALVHERLYQKEDLSGINFSDYIYNIIKELKAVYRIDGRRVDMNINVEDIVLEIDSAIPCGLIINELITNCFKYAFPDGRSGEVLVNFTKEGNTYNLIIKDNGVGLPAGFDYRQTSTLGMQIVNVLTKQLLGTCHIRSYGGTEALITFSGKERTDGKEENSDS
jgi:PAS domain S-box-containing protein